MKHVNAVYWGCGCFAS